MNLIRLKYFKELINKNKKLKQKIDNNDENKNNKSINSYRKSLINQNFKIFFIRRIL